MTENEKLRSRIKTYVVVIAVMAFFLINFVVAFHKDDVRHKNNELAIEVAVKHIELETTKLKDYAESEIDKIGCKVSLLKMLESRIDALEKKRWYRTNQ